MYYYCTVTLQFFYRFEIYSKKLEGNTNKRKKCQKAYYYKSERGRIKTAVLGSIHVPYQEETEGKVGDGV